MKLTKVQVTWKPTGILSPFKRTCKLVKRSDSNELEKCRPGWPEAALGVRNKAIVKYKLHVRGQCSLPVE